MKGSAKAEFNNKSKLDIGTKVLKIEFEKFFV